MQSPPALATPSRPTNCGFSTASLVLGICSFILGPFAAIPAIITGHISLSRIKKSGGALGGRGMALAGLIMGYVITGIMIILVPLVLAGFAAGNAAIVKARKTMALATAVNIESAVTNYLTEYGTLPVTGTADLTLATYTDAKLLDTLLGLDTTVNQKQTRFLSAKEAKNHKNGLELSPDGKSAIGLYDPWGWAYRVRLDLDGDGEIHAHGKTLRGRRVIVWSCGPDGLTETKDDVVSW